MSAQINFCGINDQFTTKDNRIEICYSKILSLTKYIEFVRNSVGSEIFDNNINMLLQAEIKQNPSKFEKYGSLKWNWEKEMEIENETEQEKWNQLKINIFEGEDVYKQKMEQDKKRDIGSILHYVIPISFPAATYTKGNTDQIYVQGFGLSIYGPNYVLNFDSPPAYLRLKSISHSKFARFTKYIGLKTFSMVDYEREFKKDFDFMDAFTVSGPFIRIHSIIDNEKTGTQSEIDYFGDYSFNIHLSKVINEEKIIPRTEVDKNGNAKIIKHKVPVMKGRKEDCSPIPITKYKLLFNWMMKKKDYKKVIVPIKLVADPKDDEEKIEEETYEDLEQIDNCELEIKTN